MSQLNSRHLQSALWKRLSETNIGVYLDALRYRFDLSEEMENLGDEKLSRGYLEDLLDGIEIPLDAFFPAMRKAVVRYLTLQEESGLGVTGLVHGPPAYGVAYALRALGQGNRITVGKTDAEQNAHTTYWLHLGRSGYRLDSGRLVGAARLRDTLLKLIENHELEGGTAWRSERLVGRVWHFQGYLQAEVDETGTLDALENALRPYAGQWVPRGILQCDGSDRFDAGRHRRFTRRWYGPARLVVDRVWLDG